MATTINSGELQGEVDHSFFDSDGENKAGEKGGSPKKYNQRPDKKVSAKQYENAGDNKSSKLERTVKHLPTVMCDKKRGESHSSSGSSTPPSPVAITNCGDSDPKMLPEKHSGALMSLIADMTETDSVYQSSTETGKKQSTNLASKIPSNQSCGKFERRTSSRSLTPISPVASTNSDSSFSHVEHRKKLGPSTISEPKKSSSRSGVRKVGSPATNIDHSKGGKRNVSPLSSSECTPSQSANLDIESRKRIQTTHTHHDSQENPNRHSMEEGSLGSGMILAHHIRTRKNYSFSDNDVQRIERENMRLLQQLSHLSSNTSRRPTLSISKPPMNFITHSAGNRKRYQERIADENVTILKKLEAVKPTPGMVRVDQLADYQRLVGYLRPPSIHFSVPMSTRMSTGSTLDRSLNSGYGNYDSKGSGKSKK